MEFGRILQKLKITSFANRFGLLATSNAQKKNALAAMTKEEMQKNIRQLKDNYTTNVEMTYVLDGILKAVKENDLLMLEYVLDGLVLKKIEFDSESQKLLIAITAGQGRVRALAILQDYFDINLIAAHHLARTLLSHPYRTAIDDICALPLNGFGKANDLTLVTHLSVLIDFVKNQQAFGSLQDQNNHSLASVVLKETDMEGFAHYLNALAENKLSSAFILAGEHFFAGEIILTGDDKGVSVKVVCFDFQEPMQVSKNNLKAYFDAIVKVFPQAEFFITEVKLPAVTSEHSVFSLLNALQALHNNADSLLRHAESHALPLSQIDGLTQNSLAAYSYHFFLPPAALMAKAEVALPDFNPTMVTRSGFMGVEDTRRVDKYYSPAEHHRSVDAYIEGRYKITEYQDNSASFPYQLVSWLAGQSPDEIAAAMHRHTLTVQRVDVDFGPRNNQP